MVERFGWMTLLLLVCLLPARSAWADSDETGGWPREIKVDQGVVVIYQPQPEQLDGNQLKGRMAISVEQKGVAKPVFGAVWFSARLDTDRDERIATITDVTITQVRFPAQDETKAGKLRALLEKEIPRWDLPISMDRLLATLELAEKRIEVTKKIKNDPPNILFLPEPAVLITVDGEPRLKEEENSKLMRVVNTPFTIILVPQENKYYLYADADTWYAASDLKGEWTVAENVPSEVAGLAPAAEADPEDDEEKPGPPPKVIVATEPTELISSTGKPEFTPISETDLLYMSNTDSDVLMYIKKQEYYVLLAGRWYAGSKLEGPWRYVPGEKLPPDFARIPEESEMGTVLYAVPGTEVAKEAVLDSQIPQTATIDRKNATLTVTYDGDPKFEDIKDTQLEYAVNTATPVILFKKQYYACDQAVWFVAEEAVGPWQVAISIPGEIYTIPTACPVYNITYVRIYGYTDEVVYVGYTPGYTHTYVVHTTVVYGTGYYYPYWYGGWYYPRPATWGFHVRFSPRGGWRFGFSYCNGPFRFTIGGGGWYRGGWWGPGHHRGYRRGYRHGYRQGRRAGYRAGYRSGRRNAGHENLYRNKGNQTRMKDSPATAKNRAKAGAAGNRANNVFTDKDGNVHRKTDQGWEKRSKEGWQAESGQRDKPSQTGKSDRTKPSDSSVDRSKNRQQLDRSYQSRQRGAQQSRSFNRSRGGGGRGGRGGGRR